MNKITILLGLLFASLFIHAQNQFYFSKQDSVCIEKSYNLFLKLGENRYLANKAGQELITDKKAELLFELSSYDNLIFSPFSNGLTPVRLRENSKYGYLDRSGVLAIPCNYEKAYGFKYGYALVKKDGKYGIIDTLNNLIIPLIYEDLKNPNGEIFPANKNEGYGIIDLEEKTLLSFDFKDISIFSNGLVTVEEEDGISSYDLQKNQRGKNRYQEISGFNDRLVRFKKDEKWGLMDIEEKVVLENTYKYVGYESYNRAKIKSEDKDGVIDDKGNVILKPEFDYLSITKHMIIAKKGEVYTLLDHQGIKINENKYDYLAKIGPCDLFLKSQEDTLYSFLTFWGEEIFKGEVFDKINDLTDSLLLAKTNDSWYYYALDNSNRLGPYKGAKPFAKKRATVISKITNKKFLIDNKGVSLSKEYDNIIPTGDLYIVEQEGKFAILNLQQKRQSLKYYDELKYIDKGLFIATLNGKSGIIKEDKIILEFDYDSIEFNDHLCGYTKVAKEGKIGFVDLTGKLIMKPQLNHVDYCWLGLLLVETDTGYGILNKDMNYVINPIYEDLSHFENGKICAAKKQGKWGFLNMEEEFVIEPQFKDAKPFKYGRESTLVKDSLGWRLIDHLGEYVNDEIFSFVTPKNNKYLIVEKEDRVGVLDLDGKTLIPIRFDKIKKSYKKWTLYYNDDYLIVDEDLNCIEHCDKTVILELLKKGEK